MQRFLLFLFLFSFQTVFGQYAIRNGVSIPASDTLRVFVVFAELDFSQGPCPNNLPDNLNGSWPKDSQGKTHLPLDANTFFDAALKSGQQPKGFITDYYHSASFGKYVLLGDYFPEVITVPCSKMRIGDNGVNTVLKMLDTLKSEDGTLRTQNGYALNDFDLWTPTENGLPKIKSPDGRIDLLYVIWKNNRFLTTANTGGNSGYGVNASKGVAFKNMQGINNMASFNCNNTGSGAYTITIAEHLHGIFGGNHWHSAGGRGAHTFLATANSYGLTGQHPATMQAVSGWDRWMMHWKRADKKYVTSAYDLNGNEMETEKISIETFPQGGTFVLRDFVETGDALRIKLPHINWQQKGDVKNQYLWIENRQMKTRFDEYLSGSCVNTDEGNFPRGTPGMYAYIQVGKDIREGGKDIYSGAYEHPNGLASPFFPLSAEGNYDFYYDWDRIQQAQWIDCNWNNSNLPVNKRRSLPNPFTGFSDLYRYIDSNHDGALYSGDKLQAGLSEVHGDTVIHNYNTSGDWLDAFSSETGNRKLSISSNPAPVPVYTYTTNQEYSNFNLVDGKPAAYENRTIWLNGLLVEIMDENKESGTITIQVRWDNYEVNDDVRWCGNMVLSPNDFDVSKPSLVLQTGNKLLLDRGQSPQFHKAIEKDKNGEWLFTDPTVLTCVKDSYFYLEPKSQLVLDNNSRLVLQAGSKLVAGAKSKIIIKPGSELITEDGAQLILEAKAKIIRK
jgi:hypothetical protein